MGDHALGVKFARRAAVFNNFCSRIIPLSTFALLLTFARTSAADDPNVSIDALHERVAAMRAENEAAPLQRLEALDRAAQAHADDMAAHQQLGHVFSADQTPDARVRAQGVVATAVSQNIAAGRTAAAVLRSLTSAANRTNFVNATFTHVGYGVAIAGRVVYVAQILAAIDLPENDSVPIAPDVALVPEAPTATLAPSASAVVQTPMALGVAPETRPGYWICYGNRWWFYPLPTNVQNGQQLAADTSVRGAPPGYEMQRCVDRTQVAVSVPSAPQAYQPSPTYAPSYIDRRYARPTYVQPAPVYQAPRRSYRAPRRVYVGPGAQFQIQIR